eukprot:gene2557-biopygen3953
MTPLALGRMSRLGRLGEGIPSIIERNWDGDIAKQRYTHYQTVGVGDDLLPVLCERVGEGAPPVCLVQRDRRWVQTVPRQQRLELRPRASITRGAARSTPRSRAPHGVRHDEGHPHVADRGPVLAREPRAQLHE